MTVFVNVGPFTNSERGGIINAANETLYAFSELGCETIALSTQGKSKLLSFLNIFFSCIRTSFYLKQKIFIFHCTYRSMLAFGALILLLRIIGQNVVVRKFAGDLDLKLNATNPIFYIYSLTIIRVVNIFFVETDFLKSKLVKKRYLNSANIKIWENTRNIPDFKPKYEQNGEYVFVSRVSRDKGIMEIIAAAQNLEEIGIKIDIYGPLEDISVSEIRHPVTYRGVLKTENDVLRVLRNADGLILPSRYQSEGCPGIILEAFSVGTPVLVSNWRALPELVDDAGVVFPTNTVTDMISAINEIRNDYLNFSRKALERSKLFNTKRVHIRIKKELEALV